MTVLPDTYTHTHSLTHELIMVRARRTLLTRWCGSFKKITSLTRFVKFTKPKPPIYYTPLETRTLRWSTQFMTILFELARVHGLRSSLVCRGCCCCCWAPAPIDCRGRRRTPQPPLTLHRDNQKTFCSTKWPSTPH